MLHPQHKLLFWKIHTNSLPTRARLQICLKLVNIDCLICGADCESIVHLFTKCPLIAAIWANSAWQLRIDRLITPNLIDCMMDILHPQPKLV